MGMFDINMDWLAPGKKAKESSKEEEQDGDDKC